MGELSKLHVMFNQLKLHIREGIIVKWYLFLTVMLVSFSLSMVYIFIGNSAIERYSDTQQLTFLNVVAYIFRGMQEYNPAEGKEFIIEDNYLIWNVMLAIIVGMYPLRNLKKMGKISLLQVKNRLWWWLSICLWSVVTVFLYYVMVYIGAFVAVFLMTFIMENVNVFSSGFDIFLLKRVFGITYDTVPVIFWIKIFVLPICASLAISGMQVALSFLAGEAVGYISVIAVCIISAFSMKPIWIGNCMMAKRYIEINPNGIGMAIPIIICLAVWIVSVSAGYIYFNNKDIL